MEVPAADARGDGRGILFQRANVPTGNYHTEKILAYSDGELFDIITNGRGLMAGYRWPIAVPDRWAIVAYVRELQRQRRERAATAPDGAPPAAPAAAPAASPASAPDGSTGRTR